MELSNPPTDAIWWFAWAKGTPESELHVRIKTRLWIDAQRMAAEALGVQPEDVCLIHEGEAP